MKWSFPSLMVARPVNVASGLALGTLDQRSGNGNAMPAHALVGVSAGALLVVMTSIGISGASCTVTSSPVLVWTKQADVADTSTEIHTAVFTAGGSIDVTPNWGDATSAFSVCQVVTGNETTPAGAATSINRADPPSFGEGCQGDITTTRANSIIFGVVADRSNVAGTKTYLDTPTELYAQQTTGPFFYTFYKQATSIALHTMGMTSPSTGAAMGLCLYEVRTP